MYSFQDTIRYSEVEADERLSPFGVVNYFQDCSTFQSMSIHAGIEELMASKRAWILSHWQVVFHRRPKLGEKVTIMTWPYLFEKFFGMRNFEMRGASEEILAVADSMWLYFDTQTKKPTRASQADISGYGSGERSTHMEYEPRKIHRAEHMEAMEPFAVRRTDIDTNLHVNNGQYVRMAQEYLPKDFEVRQLRVEYKSSAVYGDIIYPYVGVTQSDRLQVDLRNTDGATFALLEWMHE